MRTQETVHFVRASTDHAPIHNYTQISIKILFHNGFIASKGETILCINASLDSFR